MGLVAVDVFPDGAVCSLTLDMMGLRADRASQETWRLQCGIE
jgi:hypothetical protein